MKRIAVYGDVNLNLIDGSSVWLMSLVQTLAQDSATEVLVVPAAPDLRPVLSGSIRGFENVRIRQPQFAEPTQNRKLAPAQAIEELKRLRGEENFDALILRGFDVCFQAAASGFFDGIIWSYLTDIPQCRADMSEYSRTRLQTIAEASQYVLAQTETLRSFIEWQIPSARRKTALLPPMIPNCSAPPAPSPTNGAKRIVYAGKFAPQWGCLELFDVFARLRSEFGSVELHVFGDKIHAPKDDPGYHDQVYRSLTTTDGLVWHKGKSREDVVAALPQMDLAWSWRSPELNSSLELSTKVLEYGAAGLPVLLNRNEMHENLLGGTYPLMVADVSEAYDLCKKLWDAPHTIAAAATTVSQASQSFTFESVHSKHLRPLIARLGGSSGRGLPSVLIAGHDLRFVRGLAGCLERLGCKVLFDHWQGHTKHDENRSRELLREADIVIAEWCLGNAVWYSRNIQRGQKLFIRLHLQERDTEHPAKVDMTNVSRVIFVGPHILREVQQKFRWPKDKLLVIDNYVDDVDFERAKLGTPVFNLGISGICPARKRFDLALDILEELRAKDERFVLYVKGKRPEELGWLWKRPDEREYYESIAKRIERSPLLSASVVFDGYEEDIAAWYRKIGFVLSTSDFESFHLAIPEAAISGTIPVLLPWEGADEIYPADWVHENSHEAASFILETIASERFLKVAHERQLHAKEHFAIDTVLRSWCKLLSLSQHAEWGLVGS